MNNNEKKISLSFSSDKNSCLKKSLEKMSIEKVDFLFAGIRNDLEESIENAYETASVEDIMWKIFLVDCADNVVFDLNRIEKRVEIIIVDLAKAINVAFGAGASKHAYARMLWSLQIKILYLLYGQNFFYFFVHAIRSKKFLCCSFWERFVSIHMAWEECNEDALLYYLRKKLRKMK